MPYHLLFINIKAEKRGNFHVGFMLVHVHLILFMHFFPELLDNTNVVSGGIWASSFGFNLVLCSIFTNKKQHPFQDMTKTEIFFFRRILLIVNREV